MNIDSEVSALLSVAMNETCKTRKAAALALVEVLRSGRPIDIPARLADVTERSNAPALRAEVMVLARQIGLG